MKIKAFVPGHGIILHLQLLNNRLKQFCKKLTRMNYVIFNILMDLNNLSVFPQGVAVSDARGELI